jgi:hypothetical protein
MSISYGSTRTGEKGIFLVNYKGISFSFIIPYVGTV